jgi:hypothetical protein
VVAAEAVDTRVDPAARYHLSRAREHMMEAEQALARRDPLMTCVHSVRAKAHADLVLGAATLAVAIPANEAVSARCYRLPGWGTLASAPGS